MGRDVPSRPEILTAAGANEPSAAARRRAVLVIRAAGTLVAVLAVILLAVFPSAPVAHNTPGFSTPIVGFELASDPADVFGILGAPDAPGRPDAVRRMALGNRIDLLFLVGYAALYAGIAWLLQATGRMSGPLAAVQIALAVTMAIGDALENRTLLQLADMTDPPRMLAALQQLRLFTLVKWYAIYVASGLTAFAVARAADWWRWSAPFFGAAALLGVVSLVHLPAIEYGSWPLVVAWLMTWVYALRA